MKKGFKGRLISPLKNSLYKILARKPSFVWKLDLAYKSQPTQLKILKPRLYILNLKRRNIYKLH